MPAFLLSHAAFAYQFYLNYLPNAEKVTVGSISIHRWHALGHELPDSTMPQLKRSDFGREFARAGYRWTEELCRADTDGDGLSNGEELGDPNCTWKYGEPHPPADTVSHPGVDERVVPFDALPVTITPEQRKNATDQWHLFFEHVPPRGAPPWPSEEAYVLRIGNRVLFSLYYILFPALWLLATFVRRKFAIGISLWGWLMAWLLLYSGIAIGSHRLFSHGAFEPARWFKCVMIFLGTMTGQGEPRYWAMMHRIHHNRCEEGGVDPHSPAEELERSYLGFAHGGFLYDRMELYELEKRAPDLMDSDHAVFADGKGILTFLLLPPLLGNSAAVYSFLTHTPAAASAASVGARMRRAAAVGYTAVSFYFYLPCVMAWQNSMLVNSAVHSWGYESYEDAMSSHCTGKNLPILFPFMLGEDKHNNHHGEPGAISAWHRWWEFDVWPVVVWLLEQAGAVQSSQPPRLSRAFPDDDSIGAVRGRRDLMGSHTPYTLTDSAVGFWDEYIWLQTLVVFLFYGACFAWRRRAMRSSEATSAAVSAVLIAFALALIAFGSGYIFTDVELRQPRQTAGPGAVMGETAVHALRSVGVALRDATEGRASAASLAIVILAYACAVSLSVLLAAAFGVVGVLPAWLAMSFLSSKRPSQSLGAAVAVVAMVWGLAAAAAAAADKVKVI